MERNELDKSNVQGKPYLRQRAVIDEYIAKQQAVGRIDEATGQRYNQGTFVREVIDEFFQAEASLGGALEEQLDALSGEVTRKLDEVQWQMRFDLAQFFKAILLNPKLVPEVSTKQIDALLKAMFPDQ